MSSAPDIHVLTPCGDSRGKGFQSPPAQQGTAKPPGSEVELPSAADQLSEFIDSLGSTVALLGRVEEPDVEAAERELGVSFPSVYRGFLLRYGAIGSGRVTIFGLGGPEDCSPSVLWASKLLHSICPTVPALLVPIELREDGTFACLHCAPESSEDPTCVVLLHPDTFSEGQLLPAVADDFSSYVAQRLERSKWTRVGLRQLARHVHELHGRYGYDHADGGDLPRNHDWRPYRFCVQDVVLGMTVVRHLVDQNCLEVDVFLTADVQEFEAGSGARGLTMFLLTEAYKCGGTMEIRFTPNVEGGRLPIALQQLARQLDPPVERGRPATITPEEARRLYLALTPFTPFGRDRLRALAAAGMISPERACYTVNHGVWSVSEVETLLDVSQHPDRIFAGGASPLQRLAYLEDLHAGRTAVLGGLLQVTLSQRVPERPASEQGAGNVLVEDDVRPIDLEFDGDLVAQVYRSPEEAILLPWLESEGDACIPAGEQFLVALRARPSWDLALRLRRDLTDLARLLHRRSGKPGGRAFVLVPGDFFELPAGVQQSLRSAAEKWEVGLLVCPERLACIDGEVSRRFGRSRIMRQ
jgi:hypothetical protein